MAREAREGLGGVGLRHHEDAHVSAAVASGLVELVEGALHGVRRITLRFEHHPGTLEGALGGEANDGIALFAAIHLSDRVPSHLEHARRALHGARDEADHRILEVEAPASRLLVVVPLRFHPCERLADLLLEPLLPCVLLPLHLELNRALLLEKVRERGPHDRHRRPRRVGVDRLEHHLPRRVRVAGEAADE